MIGVFPGTFNPPTTAHLAIAGAAREQHGLDRVDLVVSRRPLGKDHVERPTLDERVDVLRQIADRLGWLGVTVSDRQLIADLAQGYDVVVMGADKWHQIHDPAFYDDSSADRDAALARLPRIAVVRRAGLEVPADLLLEIDAEHHEVSSTLARSGRIDVMVREARESGLWLA